MKSPPNLRIFFLHFDSYLSGSRGCVARRVCSDPSLLQNMATTLLRWDYDPARRPRRPRYSDEEPAHVSQSVERVHFNTTTATATASCVIPPLDSSPYHHSANISCRDPVQTRSILSLGDLMARFFKEGRRELARLEERERMERVGRRMQDTAKASSDVQPDDSETCIWITTLLRRANRLKADLPPKQLNLCRFLSG